MRGQIRQGDVLLIPVEPRKLEGCTEEHRGRIVLAEGEATGHIHVVDSPLAATYIDEAGGRFLQVGEATELQHIDSRLEGESDDPAIHDSVDVQEGVYRAVQQREYDPFQDVTRPVVD